MTLIGTFILGALCGASLMLCLASILADPNDEE